MSRAAEPAQIGGARPVTPAESPLETLRGVAADLDRRADGWEAAGIAFYAESLRTDAETIRAALLKLEARP